jgi:hypothetical protein
VGFCDIGIEAGAELAAAMSDSMIVRDNVIYNCNTGGMFIGGYATGRGWTTNCVVSNNTFYLNDRNNTGSGEFLIQKSHDNIIRNNIFYTTAQEMAVSVAFNAAYCYNNTTAYNLFFSAAGGTDIGGVFLDAHAVTGDPLFVNAAAGNFALQTGSAARNAGDPAFGAAAGETDLYGNTRVQETRADCGATEYGNQSIAPQANRPRHRRLAKNQRMYDINGNTSQGMAAGIYFLVSDGQAGTIKKLIIR